ncbi:MAG TPA: allophanate hydrolase [Acidimicrobiia bacterium]
MREPTPWPIVDARDLAAREGAAAVVRELLARRSRAPQSAAWISQPSPDALWARAAEIDAALAAGADLPLAGVPFAVKDNIDVAEVATTAGCAEFAYVPVASAPVVEQLLAAGAVFAGKTNLDQFATGLVGTRAPRYGPCRNPLDPDLIAGGSSSGSAIVVATGEVPFALGTDTAGSGRVPAALCGIVGAKPAPGVLSNEGVVPAMRSFDCISVFTGNAADAETVYDVWRIAMPGPVAPPLRLGIPTPIDWHGDDDARACFEGVVVQLIALGCAVEEVDAAPMYDAGALLYGSALVAERYAAFGEFALAHRDALDPAVFAIVERAREFHASELLSARASLRAQRDAVARAWWSRVDALIVPTVARIPTFAESLADLMGPSVELGQLTAFVNPLGLAALSVPAGRRSSGLPFGVTLVGPGASERALLALAPAFVVEPAATLEPSAEATVPSDPSDPSDAQLATRPLRIAVVGAHLTGQPLNHQLTDRGAVLCASTATADEYRLYALATTPPKPGLVRTPGRGAAIDVEVWAIDTAGFGEFVAAIPAPLGIGKVQLADGSEVPGFVCEPYAIDDAPDITEHGGWRAYLAASASLDG